MDARLFRLPTSPNFYAAVGSSPPFDKSEQQKNSQLPTQDSRFPGWAAPMSDGRLVTNYQNHCSQNVPTGQQFATKNWMTHNANDIISVTRKRFSEHTGAIYGVDTTVVPPPTGYVECTRSECNRTATNKPGGLGVERLPQDVPELFGTWDSRVTGVTPRPNVGITTKYEGGRNTPRGNVEPELK
jgi:hypothetical protein